MKKIYLLLFLSINLLLVSCATQTIGQKIEKEETIKIKEKDSRIALHFNNLNKMLDRLKIPKGLNEIGVPEDCYERIAKKSMLDQAYGQNPKKANLDELNELVINSIKKAR